MHWFITMRHIVEHWGMLGAFAVMVIENLGIPFPTEIGFLVAQGLISAGDISYPLAVIVITLGHVTGSVIAYSIGRWGDKKLTHYFTKNKRLKSAKERIEEWYHKYGSATIFFTRNFGYVRPWASLIAGFAKAPFTTFLLWTTIGSLVFSSFTLYITKYVVFIWQNNPDLHIIMSIIVGILFFGLIAAELGRNIYEKIFGKK